MNTIRALSLGLCLAAGCAATPSTDLANLKIDPRAVGVQVRALVSGQTDQQWITPKDTLHSGDQISLRTVANQPVFVYVVRVSAKGPAQVLFENQGQSQARKDTPLDIPDGNSFIQLGNEVGDEDLRIVASTQPLTTVKVEEAVAASKPESPREPPPVMTDRNRLPYTVWGLLDDRGMAVVRFTFHHQ